MLYVTLAIVLIVGTWAAVVSWWGMRRHYSVDDLDRIDYDGRWR